MKDIVARVGFRIREIREEKGLSQEKMAGLADTASGITAIVYCNVFLLLKNRVIEGIVEKGRQALFKLV